jgi:uncharacterized damage-inducible protein DinB
MPTTLIDRHRRWFAYECDAHAKVFASLQTVPPDARTKAEYRKAVGLMAHIVMARRVWLGRLGTTPPVSGSLFPDDPDALRVAEEWEDARRLWIDYLAALDDADLGREFEYQSLDAGRFRNRVEDILDQLFGHSSYHRGQIAMLVRAAGGQPAVTDLIYWCREPVE